MYRGASSNRFGTASGILGALASCAVLLTGCGDGGTTSVSFPGTAEGIFGKLGDPLPSATPEQRRVFQRGLQAQARRFTPATGLGPQFNVTSCGACHEKPAPGGSSARYRNFLLVGQELPDGTFKNTGVGGIQDQFTLKAIGRVPDPENTNVRATRNAIPFFGVGLMAEIPDESILENADPDDRDGDGISGRPNYESGYLGRFGVKAQTANIEKFVRGPLFNHAGITSNPLPPELVAQLPMRAVGPSAKPSVDDDDAPDPELSSQDLFDLLSFAMLLAAPEPDPPTDATRTGQALFAQARCTSCHVPALRSPRGLVPLYSDLLLHDMGPDLADGIRQGVATGSEFRTQPLWGVGVAAPYLHDGRADTLDEAIRMHGGEAEAARDAYEAFDERDRALVLAFLNSLGGASQTTAGLLPPDAPIPDAGTYGGPDRVLTSAELDRFVAGRAEFDRDVTRDQGLGTAFNGDSCRGCHSTPVIGGAGPSGVDVTRQAIIDANGNFVEPAGGTLAHHDSLRPERPDADPLCNWIELRQTPPLFGIGLIDQIPAATILALQDPLDANGDGIRGIASVLPDGRLGRFGWKANVPSVAEFARDALSNEEGVTLADQSAVGLDFGAATDNDGVADPELGVDKINAIVYFMDHLAPPPRTSTDPALERQGEALFSQVGCASCHVPELETANGTPVRLYSDLLLHETLPKGMGGVVVGMASMRAFRTAPLWGLSKSAPYMHNGRAFTPSDAIIAHDGEASAARQAFQQLSPSDRDALLAFLQSL